MPDIMWVYWITVPLGIVMFSVAVWVIKSEQIQDVTKRTDVILTRIHKRMLELEDKAADQYYRKHSIKEFLDLLNDIEGTMGKDTGLEDIEKGLRGKKLSKNRGKKRAQIDNLLDQVKPTLSTDWSLDELVKFVNKFNRFAQIQDKRYEGLDILRDKDRRWAKLFSELQNVKTEFNDALLNKMIDGYIDWSYGCSGMSLLSDLIRHAPAEILPTEYLESEVFRPSIKVENTMTQLRGEIVNRIKELLSVNLGTQIEEQNEQGDFLFEFNDNSITTKDGRLILGVSYSTTKRITVEILQLDYNGKRFRPNDWLSIEIERIHTQNYTFDLNALRAMADEASQEAVFIAKADGVECRSRPFNIHKLL